MATAFGLGVLFTLITGGAALAITLPIVMLMP